MGEEALGYVNVMVEQQVLNYYIKRLENCVNFLVEKVVIAVNQNLLISIKLKHDHTRQNCKLDTAYLFV